MPESQTSGRRARGAGLRFIREMIAGDFKEGGRRGKIFSLGLVMFATVSLSLRGEQPAELADGTRALYRGNYQRAVSLAQSYMKAHPKVAAAHLLLARAEIAEGKYPSRTSRRCGPAMPRPMRCPRKSSSAKRRWPGSKPRSRPSASRPTSSKRSPRANTHQPTGSSYLRSGWTRKMLTRFITWGD